MPRFYPDVHRLDPRQALTTAATAMADYLRRYDCDVRKALAAYNAGPGTVARLVSAYGADWERGLPTETRSYLNTIVGTDRPRLTAGTVSGFSSARIETPASGSITQDFAEGHHALDIGTAMGSPIRGGDGRRRAATGGRVVDVRQQERLRAVRHDRPRWRAANAVRARLRHLRPAERNRPGGPGHTLRFAATARWSIRPPTCAAPDRPLLYFSHAR